jgi:hypothetical protein
MVVAAVRLSTHEEELFLRIIKFRGLVVAILLSMGEGFMWVALFAFWEALEKGLVLPSHLIGLEPQDLVTLLTLEFWSGKRKNWGRAKMPKFMVKGAAKEAQQLWSNLVHEKPVLPYLIPVFFLAWVLERWIIPFSNWIPVFVTVWATLQVLLVLFRDGEQINPTNKQNKKTNLVYCTQQTRKSVSQWLYVGLHDHWQDLL